MKDHSTKLLWAHEDLSLSSLDWSKKLLHVILSHASERSRATKATMFPYMKPNNCISVPLSCSGVWGFDITLQLPLSVSKPVAQLTGLDTEALLLHIETPSVLCYTFDSEIRLGLMLSPWKYHLGGRHFVSFLCLAVPCPGYKAPSHRASLVSLQRPF